MALYYGFLDETGDVGRTGRSSRYLIIAIVLTSDPKSLRRTIVRARKRLGKRLRDIPEFEARHTPKSVVARLLRDVASLEIEIVAVVLDKHQATFHRDAEDWYRQASALAISYCLGRHPALSMYLDKRYTNPRQRRRLVDGIMQRIQVQQGIVFFEHVDSQHEKAIQVADAVAWAFAQKYEWGDDTLYNIVRGRVIVEEVIEK